MVERLRGPTNFHAEARNLNFCRWTHRDLFALHYVHVSEWTTSVWCIG